MRSIYTDPRGQTSPPRKRPHSRSNTAPQAPRHSSLNHDQPTLCGKPAERPNQNHTTPPSHSRSRGTREHSACPAHNDEPGVSLFIAYTYIPHHPSPSTSASKFLPINKRMGITHFNRVLANAYNPIKEISGLWDGSPIANLRETTPVKVSRETGLRTVQRHDPDIRFTIINIHRHRRDLRVGLCPFRAASRRSRGRELDTRFSLPVSAGMRAPLADHAHQMGACMKRGHRAIHLVLSLALKLSVMAILTAAWITVERFS